MNKKDAFLPRTPLDYLVEAVEAEFGSVENAPDYAMEPIWNYVKRHHMGVYNHNLQKDNSIRMKKRQSKRFSKKHDARGGLMVPTKLWQQGKDKKWFTNNKRIAKASELLNKNPKLGVQKASQKSHCSPIYFSRYPLTHQTLVYTCGPKVIKADSKSHLIGKCRKDKFPFAPMNFYDIYNNRYMGTIKNIHHYDVVHYSKNIPKGVNHE